MSEPRPELLRDTPANTPWFRRPSTWTGIATILLDWSAFASLVAGVLNPAQPDPRWLIGAAALKLLGSNVAVVQTWFVRLGVTHANQAVETLAARTERELQKPLPPSEDLAP